MKRPLSKVLSEAIIQALEDLELCMEDPDYTIDFADWHSPFDQFKESTKKSCSVCFAGAVMAKSFGMNKSKLLSPSSFGEHENILRALDYIRRGDVAIALRTIDETIPSGLVAKFDVPQRDYKKFKSTMIEISNHLTSFGL